MSKLLIVRHGNTFDKGDVLLRVGKRTDLPLSMSGTEQAVILGDYLMHKHPKIDKVYTSNLQRTKQTALVALDVAGLPDNIEPLDIFDEIDYGPDEGKPEEEVVARLGQEALHRWDMDAVVPNGWLVDVEKIKQDWKNFAKSLEGKHKTVMVVTSNGTARFAPYILENAEDFMAENNIKLSTGSISCLSFNGRCWEAEYWNRKPKDFV